MIENLYAWQLPGLAVAYAVGGLLRWALGGLQGGERRA